jgi:hypothetical protein
MLSLTAISLFLINSLNKFGSACFYLVYLPWLLLCIPVLFLGALLSDAEIYTGHGSFTRLKK